MEKKIAKNVKTNPTAFWQYVQSKLKTIASIPDLIKPGTEENPSFTKTDEEQADALSNDFSSVFTIEQDTGHMPFFENSDFKESLLNIDLTEDLVIKNLKINESPGQDTINPRVIHEIAESVAVSWRIYSKLLWPPEPYQMNGNMLT